MAKLRTTFVSTLLTGFASVALAQQTDIPGKAPKAPDIDHVYTEAPDDHTIGNADAAQTLIIYASVTCPHCRDWFTDHWDKVKAELIDTDTTRVVFRELPTAPAQMSMTGFLLAECAPRTDYFDIITYQMKNQDKIFKAAQTGQARAEYQTIAEMAGMKDEEAITACLRNPDMMAHIQASSLRLQASGASGVPAFFVNGERYDGETDAKTMIGVLREMDTKGMSSIPKSAQKRTKPKDMSDDHSGHDHD